MKTVVYSREETSARIIALRGMDKQILSNRWKDLHWTDDRIATFTEKERKKMKVNREVDHTTGEKRLGEERRLRENPPHVLYFLYEKEDEINNTLIFIKFQKHRHLRKKLVKLLLPFISVAIYSVLMYLSFRALYFRCAENCRLGKKRSIPSSPESSLLFCTDKVGGLFEYFIVNLIFF